VKGTRTAVSEARNATPVEKERFGCRWATTDWPGGSHWH